MCKTVRHHADICDHCFIGIPWNNGELMFVMKAFASFVLLKQMEATIGPAAFQATQAELHWPPLWLLMIPSLHGGDSFSGIPACRIDEGTAYDRPDSHRCLRDGDYSALPRDRCTYIERGGAPS